MSELSWPEKAMAPHCSTLAWKIPWTEEPARLQSMGSLRVGHDWATSLSCIGEGNGNPLQCSCLENPRDGGAWGAAVYGVAQSRTRLKWLSGSSKLSWYLQFKSITAEISITFPYSFYVFLSSFSHKKKNMGCQHQYFHSLFSNYAQLQFC